MQLGELAIFTMTSLNMGWPTNVPVEPVISASLVTSSAATDPVQLLNVMQWSSPGKKQTSSSGTSNGNEFSVATPGPISGNLIVNQMPLKSLWRKFEDLLSRCPFFNFFSHLSFMPCDYLKNLHTVI